MNKIGITPTTHYTKLEEPILRIINLVMVERIYSLPHQEGDSIVNELVILISNKATQALAELSPIINTILFSYPTYHYRLFYAHQVKDGIRKGNLFLYDRCSADNLVYSDPTSDFNLYPDGLDISILLENAKLRFSKEMHKIHSFSAGADFYTENENYTHAAFMVHQHIEMSFRAIEQFAMGKDKITHSIKAHQKNVASYLPDMGLLFKEQDEAEEKLMQQLDDAYLAVRYEDNYLINKDKLLLAKEKGKLAERLAEAHYIKIIEEFETKHLHKSTETDKKAIKEVEKDLPKLEKVVQQLCKCTDVFRIYCFGRREYNVERKGILNDEDNINTVFNHYDLLVIANDEQALYNFQGNFNSDKSFNDTLLLLVHNEEYLIKSLESKDLFFHRITGEGELVYLNEGLKSEFATVVDLDMQIDQKKLESVQCKWFDRWWNARGVILSAYDIQELECMPAKVCMLNQGMEQLCHGLIEVYLSYKPERHTVGHLFDLCCSFLAFPEEIFPRNNTEDKELFKIMGNSINALRYKGTVDISPEEMTVLEKRCSSFLDKADDLVRLRFKNLTTEKN